MSCEPVILNPICPLSPPILGDFRPIQSPPELGDLGGVFW